MPWCEENVMKIRSTVAVAIAALCAIPLAAALLPGAPASAHGTLQGPPSRAYTCRFLENPENPTSGACKAAKDLGGTQPFYDWNSVLQSFANGNHRALIPDGQLCSAGREKFRGFDLPRTDWPATKVTAGSRTLVYNATAPHHNGNFTFYITKQGWNPAAGLKWGDLVQIAYFDHTPNFSWTVNLPARTGRHVIYSTWQRTDSPEAFYTCSDVVY
jgi:chitin-binding protein